MCVLRSNALNEWLPHKAGYLGHGKQPKLSTGEGSVLTVITDLIFNPLWFANFLLFLIITSLGPISPKVVWEGKKYTRKFQGWISHALLGSDSFQHETSTPYWTSAAGSLPCHRAVQVTWYGCANKDCQVRKSDVCQPQRRGNWLPYTVPTWWDLTLPLPWESWSEGPRVCGPSCISFRVPQTVSALLRSGPILGEQQHARSRAHWDQLQR